MAMKCLSCGYKMKTWQEAVSVASEAVLRYLGISSLTDPKLKSGIVAGAANSLDIACPKCRERSRWEDC
jgi:hypothetical protein